MLSRVGAMMMNRNPCCVVNYYHLIDYYTYAVNRYINVHVYLTGTEGLEYSYMSLCDGHVYKCHTLLANKIHILDRM